MTGDADTVVKGSVASARCCWHGIPRVHFHGARAQALEVEVWTVIWMPRRDSFVTDVAMEKDHVAKDTLDVEHSSEQRLAEGHVYLCGGYLPGILRTYGCSARKGSVGISVEADAVLMQYAVDGLRGVWRRGRVVVLAVLNLRG